MGEITKVTRGKLVIAILALLALTGLTWWLSYVPTGAWETPISLGIAAVKVSIVGLFFMDLAETRGVLRLVAVVAPLFITVMILLMLGDVMFR